MKIETEIDEKQYKASKLIQIADSVHFRPDVFFPEISFRKFQESLGNLLDECLEFVVVDFRQVSSERLSSDSFNSTLRLQ